MCCTENNQYATCCPLQGQLSVTVAIASPEKGVGKFTQFESFSFLENLKKQNVVNHPRLLSVSQEARIPLHTPCTGREHHPAPSENQDSLSALPGTPSSALSLRILIKGVCGDRVIVKGWGGSRCLGPPAVVQNQRFRVCKRGVATWAGCDTQQGYPGIPVPKKPTDIIVVGSTVVESQFRSDTEAGDSVGDEGQGRRTNEGIKRNTLIRQELEAMTVVQRKGRSGPGYGVGVSSRTSCAAEPGPGEIVN